ncbi:3'-5' exonuclease [Alteribacter natronophilus]|uniref:3'-5' exonuclease n=1 Tax=Alteribacter natronophilus TaxID=2583810 RepID=UPI00110D403A|nr:exonuclease domain-containing protein [Alteribacter natronophilus]TMW73372.1 3'-5' exonuclease [Alteribacter natronophilus]
MRVSILHYLRYVMMDTHLFRSMKLHWIRNNRPLYEALIDELKEMKPDESVITTSLDDLTYTVFDLETTGFYPRMGDEVISIGAMKVNANHIRFPEHFYEVVRPFKPVPDDVLKLTGLTSAEIRQGEAFLISFFRFVEFASNTVLVAYPASFDVVFLQELTRRWGLKQFTPYYIDAQKVADYLYPNEKNSLDRIISRLGVKNRQRHHALNDAHMTADVFLYLIEELKKRNITTYRQLSDIITVPRNPVIRP